MHDALGIRLRMTQGATFAIVSGYNFALLFARSTDLEISLLQLGVGNKASAIRTLKFKLDVSRCETAAIGADIPDHALFDRVTSKSILSDVKPEPIVAATRVPRTSARNTVVEALAFNQSVSAQRAAATVQG